MKITKSKTPKPRVGFFYGQQVLHVHVGDTWIEGEEMTYPSGAQIRRAYARCEDGRLRVITCGIADTFFSIPGHTRINSVYTRGYVGSDESGFFFHAYKDVKEVVSV